VPGPAASGSEASDWDTDIVQIWVGLGNPGAQYAMHRHNVGFMAIDAIAEVHRIEPPKKAFARLGSAGPDRLDPCPAAEARHLHERQRPRRPRRAATSSRREVGDVTVFHDELDLAPSRSR
jgi:PTH1 family peptidyl-tRNA hydrolase